jgi:murein DD-endopeptidase MepM/ murein hydrolase activator NlpD
MNHIRVTRLWLVIAVAGISACSPVEIDDSLPLELQSTSIVDATSTLQPTATITPTPTATAQAAVVTGDPRIITISEPVRQAGAPCGFVDTLDFPLDPPHAIGARGGTDFGRFRERYDGFHTGEDWGIGSSSFGQPVHSIGHGRVTYAQPNGWGADKGVVIVEHTFRDRGRTYSFYGHLDPPSIELRAGTCVERGDLLGAIGDPRSPPHLHFEIRTHSPQVPGPGYWPRDPQLSGWLPPSATIWNYRVTSAPGVLWSQLEGDGLTSLVALEGDGLLLIQEGLLLKELDQDGQVRWEFPLTEDFNRLAADSDRDLLYVLDSKLSAYALSDLRDHPETAEARWGRPIIATRFDRLVPLSDGGVLVTSRNGAMAVNSSGVQMWRGDAIGDPLDWVEFDGALVLLTNHRETALWTVDHSGAVPWEFDAGGEMLASSEQLHLYGEEGVYRLNPDDRSADRIYALPDGFSRLGSMEKLKDGRLLVVHRDVEDKRLLLLEVNGTMLWERSIAELPSGKADLIVHGDEAYVLLSNDTSGTVTIDAYSVDLTTPALTRILSVGTRSPDASLDAMWHAAANDGTLYISPGGAGLFLLDPAEALNQLQNSSAIED